MEQKRLEELCGRLVEGRWLSQPRLDHAREEARRTGHSLWFVLVKLRYLSQEEVMMFFSCESGIPFVRISDYSVDPALLDLLDRDFCIQHALFPLFISGDILYVASDNPFDAAVIDAVRRMSGRDAELLIASASSIRAAQDLYWNLEERMFGAEEFVLRPRKKLYGVSLYRKAERIALRLPAVITVKDETVMFAALSCLNATTIDITKDGRAVGIESAYYLPPQLPIYIEFKLPGGPLPVQALVVNCRMEKGGRYLAGVTLGAMNPGERGRLLKAL